MRSYHKGSAHVVIIIILVVALLGTLGFVFYQNFIQKKEDAKTVSNATSENKSNSTSDAAKVPPAEQEVPKIYTQADADKLVADTYAKYIKSRKAGTSSQGALEGVKFGFTDAAYTAVSGTTDVEGLTCAGNYVPDSVEVTTSVSGTVATSLVKRVFQGQTASTSITVTTDLSALKISAVTCPK